MRRAFLSVLLLVSTFLMIPASPATAAPYCGLVWGSLDQVGAVPVAGAGGERPDRPAQLLRPARGRCRGRRRRVHGVLRTPGGAGRLRRADPDPWRRRPADHRERPGVRRQRQPDLLAGQPARAARRLRVPHVPAGRVRRDASRGTPASASGSGHGCRSACSSWTVRAAGHAWSWTSRTAGDQAARARRSESPEPCARRHRRAGLASGHGARCDAARRAGRGGRVVGARPGSAVPAPRGSGGGSGEPRARSSRRWS